MKHSGVIHIGIRRSRLKWVGIGYGVLAFVVFMTCYFAAGQVTGAWSWILKIGGGVVAIFLAVTGASAIQILRKKDAGLRIDGQGITDHATLISPGLIEWKAINGLECDPKSRMVLVLVKNPAAFIKQAKNRAIRQLLERNLQLYGTPLVIESKYLDCSFDDLKQQLEESERMNLSPRKPKRGG